MNDLVGGGNGPDLPQLGKLEAVPLREAWMREDYQFTPWLAQPENLELLGKSLGLDLELEGVEKNVGPFRADILCRDVRDERLVLIENQLERSDHTHLGQLITYTAGLETATIIWITAQFTDEHRAALDWLNAATDQKFQFFGLEIQLWRIDESMMAPSFKIIAKPNDWTKKARRAARAVESGELTEIGQKRGRYWSAFREFLDQHSCPIKMSRDYATGHVPFRIGDGPFVVTVYRSVKGPGVFVRTSAQNVHEIRDALQPYREELEAAAGRTFIGPDGDPTGHGWFRVEILEADPSDESDWPRQFEWIADNLDQLRQAVELLHGKLSDLDLS